MARPRLRRTESVRLLLMPRVIESLAGPAKARPVKVDWNHPPDPRLGRLFDLHQMPAYVVEPWEPLSKKQKDPTLPYYAFTADFDDDVHKSQTRPKMRKHALCQMKGAEIGWVGGIGYRTYFMFLGKLCKVFWLLALLNTPSLYLNLMDNFYDSRNITDMTRLSVWEVSDDWTRYFPGQTEPWGARGTLGSVRVSLADATNGAEPTLYIRTCLDGLSCMILLIFAAWLGYEVPKMQQESLQREQTMGAYCISIMPKEDRKPATEREKQLRCLVVARERAKTEAAILEDDALVAACERRGIESIHVAQHFDNLRQLVAKPAMAKLASDAAVNRSATDEEVTEMLRLSDERGGWAPEKGVVLSRMQLEACSQSMAKVEQNIRQLTKLVRGRGAASNEPDNHYQLELLHAFRQCLSRRHAAIRREHTRLSSTAENSFTDVILSELEEVVVVGQCGAHDPQREKSAPAIWVLAYHDVSGSGKQTVKLLRELERELAKAKATKWLEFGGSEAAKFPDDSMPFAKTRIGQLIRRLQRVDTTIAAGREVKWPIEVVVAVEHLEDKKAALSKIQADGKKFHGVAVRTAHASESGTVLHDHLHYSLDLQTNGRRKVWLLTLCILVLSLAVLIFLEGLAVGTSYLTHCVEAISENGFCDPFSYPVPRYNDSGAVSFPKASTEYDASLDISAVGRAAAKHYRNSFLDAIPHDEMQQKGLGDSFPRLTARSVGTKVQTINMVHSVSDCRKLCAAESECEFYTYESQHDESGRHTHECYLKKGFGTRRCQQRPYVQWTPSDSGHYLESGPVCRVPNGSTCETQLDDIYGYNPVGLDGEPCGYAEVLVVHIGCDGESCAAQLSLPQVDLRECSLQGSSQEVHNNTVVRCCRYEDERWDQADDRQCHRVDYSGTVYNWGDRDALCYMCLCDCQHTNMEGDPHCAKHDIQKVEPGYCDAFKEWEIGSSTYKKVASAATIAFNIIVKVTIRRTASMEKAHDKAVEHANVALRIFFAQILNTGFLLIILTSDATMSRAIVDTLSIFSSPEAFPAPNYKWYSAAGGPLIATMFINFFTPIAVYFALRGFRWFYLKFKQWCCHRGSPQMGAHTQNELNANFQFMVGEWHMETAYAELLTNLFVLLLYSSGMPILLWVGAVGFTVKYWAELYVVIMFFAAPPTYGAGMLVYPYFSPAAITRLAVIFHIAAGTFFYGFVGGRHATKPLLFTMLKPHCVVFWSTSLAAVAATRGWVPGLPCHSTFFDKRSATARATQWHPLEQTDGENHRDPPMDRSVEVHEDTAVPDDEEEAARSSAAKSETSSRLRPHGGEFDEGVARDDVTSFSKAHDSGDIINKDKHYVRPEQIELQRWRIGFEDALKQEEGAHTARLETGMDSHPMPRYLIEKVKLAAGVAELHSESLRTGDDDLDHRDMVDQLANDELEFDEGACGCISCEIEID